MLDRRNMPLSVDQPEDNFDNKSVYEILVKFLKRAKKRRQIVIVTHDPNLAVVADSEQIIHVTIGLLENRFTARVFCRARRNPSRIVVVSLIPWRSSRPNPFLDRQQSRVERVGVGTRDDPFQ